MARELKKISEKHKVMGFLLDEGKSVAEASAIMGYNETHGQKIRQALVKHGLTSPRKLKLASSAVNSLLSGEAIGDSKPPDPETIRKTAEMVFDRAQPQEVTGNPDTVNLAFILQQAHESMRVSMTPPPMLPPPPVAPPVKTPEEVERERQAKKESRYRHYREGLQREVDSIE